MKDTLASCMPSMENTFRTVILVLNVDFGPNLIG